MMWQWIDTAVPFAIALALLLILFRQVQRRRSGLANGMGTWLRPPSEARSHSEAVYVSIERGPLPVLVPDGVLYDESAATSETVQKAFPANFHEVVPYKRRFKVMVWLIISPLFLVGFGFEAVGYTQTDDHAWAGTMLFFGMLMGIPTAATIAGVNAWLAELAQRRLAKWNVLVAGVIGFVSCLSLQFFGAFLGPSAVLLLILPNSLPWVLAPPLVTGVLAALVEVIVRTPRPA